MLTVAHVITDLKVGGAQKMLLRLLSRIDRNEFRSAVISLFPGGALAESFRDVADVSDAGYERGLPFASILRVARTLRRIKPDVVQTWMFHADLMGGVAARLGTRAPVLWNIRSSGLGDDSRSTRMGLRALAGLSRVVPAGIVSCSSRGRDVLVDAGYDARRFVIVPNGFETEVFKPDPQARTEIRRELSLSSDAVLIGLVARWHPVKDHAMFIRAAKRIAGARADVHFVLCGDDIHESNEALRAKVEETGCRERFHLLGRRDDTPRVTAALDVACSTSAAEAFSNSVGEAMACGVPCVVTDVGDSVMIIGDTGRAVPSGDDQAFAGSCLNLLNDEEMRANLGRRARSRIEHHFDVSSITRMYEDLYRRVAQDRR